MAKRKHKKKSCAVRMGELAPKELRQHHNVILETIDRDSDGRAYIKRDRVLDECRLDTYLDRKYIDEIEHKAGMKFRCDYIRAHFHIRLNGTLANPLLHEASRANNAEATTIESIAAMENVNKVLKILSPSQRTIVISVCGHDEFAKTTAKRRTLKRALSKFAKYWRMTQSSSQDPK